MKYRGLTLDPFQEQAISHLEQGRSVLVAAPTGTGKTLVADWIVEEALRQGKQVVYTAPIKALSNQKFRDYTRLYGDQVGLVTGDLVIRREAPCRVMTTEILRNMLLSDERLDNLLAVIIDEIHFLDDRERGTVWEEVLIYLPPAVQIVGLSATLSNLEDFAAWLTDVRQGPVEVVIEEKRTVPLTLNYASVDTGLVSPAEYHQIARRKGVATKVPKWQKQSRHKRGRRPARKTSHLHIFDWIKENDLLPYLYFVFSRRDTESCARRLGRELGQSLLSPEEQERMDAQLKEAKAELGPALDPEIEGLYRKGIAFHHAGLHVQLKALVEGLYESKLVKVLYCTSTFALGINMPARAVAFDGIKKYDGTAVRPLSTRGFMQKAGRAGRRGMDEAGMVIVRMDLEEYGELKPILDRYQRGAYEPVRSSFSLSWNSVVNLLRQHGEDRIRQILDKSFLSWHLSRKVQQGRDRADQLEDESSSSRERKEARRLRRRADRDENRVWSEFEEKLFFLKGVGYLDEELGFNAGAEILAELQIAEIMMTELVLSGILETLEPEALFGALCALTNELPRHTRLNLKARREDRRLGRELNDIRQTPSVCEAEEITGMAVVFDPSLIPLGRAWAEGRSLQEILLMVQNDTDISGDLITGFRRAKDLLGQLRRVYAQDVDRADALKALAKRVSRDEVMVVD